MFDLGIVGGKIYCNKTWQQWNLYVEQGKIAALGESLLPAKNIFDAKDLFITPGLIDPHVHLAMNAGKYRSADDFDSGSRLALSGGVTTLIDFLDEAATVQEMLHSFEERKSLAQCSLVDYSFHASLRTPQDSLEQLVTTALDLGLPTIKVYTTYDGKISDASLASLLEYSAQKNILVLCHAERDSLLLSQTETGQILPLPVQRPPISEIDQVLSLACLTEYYKGFCYIVHVSCGTTLEMLSQKYADLLGKHLYIESCPQYFQLDDGCYASLQSPLYSACPPLRSKDEQALLHKNIDMVNVLATDHCPFMRQEKYGDCHNQEQKKLHTPPMGLGSLGHAFQQMHASFGDSIIDAFTIQTARIHGLYPHKGTLMPGADADIALFEKVSDHASYPLFNFSHCDYDIYDTHKERLRTKTVFCAGQLTFHEGKIIERKGHFLPRTLCRA